MVIYTWAFLISRSKFNYSTNYTGCSFIITPTRQSSFLIPIVVDITDMQYSKIVNAINSTDFNLYAVSFGFNITKQPVNSSFCQISSLEVYRGREQAIEISYQGFSLSGSGSIEVSKIHCCMLRYLFLDP